MSNLCIIGVGMLAGYLIYLAVIVTWIRRGK
jgi:hypothetical protein